MNKYKHLMSNTMLFAVATFGSKLLPFLLLRFYTAVLPPDEYGLQVLITTTCNLILPIMYVCMGEAVIRFGLDNESKKSDVYTTAILTVLAGYVVLLILMPAMRQIDTLKDTIWLIYLYVLASALHTVTAQFVRAAGRVKLFAFDGIFTTITTVLLNILLLVYFKLGAQGYVLSIVIADALSVVMLFTVVKLYRYVKVKGIDFGTVKAMFRYAVPLVPTAVFWWVTSLSSRYFVTLMCGAEANGIFAVSFSIPNLITLVSMIFTQAWQLSAFQEYQSAEGEAFFSNVFKSYYTFVFLAASGLILLCKPILYVLTEPKFHEAWRYSPFIILAVAFSTLVTFLGTIYNAVQKNSMVMITTFIGAVINLALNFILIPRIGPQGAAIATFASYFVVFVIRLIDTRKYIKIDSQPVRIAAIVTLIIAQIWIGLSEVKYWYVWECLIILGIIVINFVYFWALIKRLLEVTGKSIDN